jgi:hypothetical protein
MSLNLTLNDDDSSLSLDGDNPPAVQLETEAWQVSPDVAFADVDIEDTAEAEILEALQQFKQKATREEQRMLDATDSEFWVALCFQNRAQKEEFLRRLDILDLGDKYLDGMAVANRLAIDLETTFEGMPIRTIDSKLTGMAPDLDEPYPV